MILKSLDFILNSLMKKIDFINNSKYKTWAANITNYLAVAQTAWFTCGNQISYQDGWNLHAIAYAPLASIGVSTALHTHEKFQLHSCSTSTNLSLSKEFKLDFYS